MLGCIGGPILAVVGAFLLLMLVGWIGSQREKVERQRQMAEDFCPKLAAAGWFGSTDECVASGDKAAIGFYMTTAGDKCRIETPATTTYPEDVDTCIEKRLKADKARGFSMWIASQSS